MLSSPRSFGWRLAALGSCVAALALGLLGCRSSSDRERASAKVSGHEAATAVAPPRPSRPPRAKGVRPELPSFVGSAKCAECHEEERAHWQRGWHAKALAKASAKSVRGRFNGERFKGTSSEASMRRVGPRFVMRTRGQGEAPEDFAVDWVVGGRHMQDNLTEFPDGRWQILPVYFHVTSKTWVDYTEAKQGELDLGHPFYWTNLRRLVQHECLDCHVTGMQVGFDEEQARWTTEFVDAGVACEACHGPGAKHSETSELEDIFQPKDAAVDLSLAVCAQCHGPRNPLFPLLDVRNRYQPGKRYEDYYDPIVVTIGGRMSGDFFADGRPKTSSFEYQGLIQSQCYLKGGATCLSCHVPPHVAKHASELPSADPDLGCKSCHKEVFAAGEAHTHHRDKEAQRCVSCHMPKLLSGVLDDFADHSIGVPNLANTIRHSIPNACSKCHADKPLPALSTIATAWWPALEARQARRVRLADAFDDATAPRSSQPLTDVVNDAAEAPTLRGAALMVLAMRFGASAAPAIIPSLGARDPLIRAKACEALGGARVVAAADALARLVDDPSARVRLAAALALAALNDARTEEAMVALLEDPATEDLLPPRMWIGGTLARRGDLDGARRQLAEAVRLAPYHTDGLWNLAEVVARQGDVAYAQRLIDRALALDPVHRGALELRRRLSAAAPASGAAPPAGGPGAPASGAPAPAAAAGSRSSP